jgi:hypothetical protein
MLNRFDLLVILPVGCIEVNDFESEVVKIILMRVRTKINLMKRKFITKYNNLRYSTLIYAL